MTRSVWAALACASLLVVGCEKKDKKGEGDKPAAPAGEQAKAEPPAGDTAAKPSEATPAPAAAALTTAETKDDFGNLAAAPDVVKNAATAPKVDVADVSKEGIPTMQVRGFAGAEATGFRVSYDPNLQQPLHQQFAGVLKEIGLYEKIALNLNQTLKLPRTVDIQLTECNTVNAFYDPNNNRIVMCYELMSYFAEMFKPVTGGDTEKLGNAILGATMFAFFHEAGHGLIHQLDLPAVGREEDAVDQFATLILIAGGDETIQMALAGAYWFQLQQEKGGQSMPFSDEHAFDGQRFYNILCWIYGSDKEKYANFVTSGTLPESRAVRCEEEFARTNKSWEKLLAPHLTTGGAENVEMEQKAPPAPVQPASAHAISCQQVVDYALQLYVQSLAQQLQGSTPEQLAQAQEQLQTQLPQLQAQLIDDCTQKDWPDQNRQCVMDAKEFQAATQCGV